MDILVSVLSLLGMLALTAGTSICVAGEFSLTALERSTVDAHLQQVGDRLPWQSGLRPEQARLRVR